MLMMVVWDVDWLAAGSIDLDRTLSNPDG